MGLLDIEHYTNCDEQFTSEIRQSCGVQKDTYTKYEIHYLNIVLLIVSLVALGVFIWKEKKTIKAYSERLVAWTKKRTEIVVLGVALIAMIVSVSVDVHDRGFRKKIDSARYHVEEFFYSEVWVQDVEYMKCRAEMQTKLWTKYRGGCE